MNNSHPEGRKKSARELQIEADNDNCAEFPVERPPPPPPVQETEPKVGELDVTEQDEPDGAKPVSHMYRRNMERKRRAAAAKRSPKPASSDDQKNDTNGPEAPPEPLIGARPFVFLCHSSKDKERVRSLYRRLQADGVQCWFDEEDLLPGQNWEYEIRRAVRNSRYVLACLSQASTTQHGYVHKELKFALDRADEQPEDAVYILPVRLERCAIPERLGGWHWVNLFDDDGYERLMRTLRPSQLDSGGPPGMHS